MLQQDGIESAATFACTVQWNSIVLLVEPRRDFLGRFVVHALMRGPLGYTGDLVDRGGSAAQARERVLERVLMTGVRGLMARIMRTMGPAMEEGGLDPAVLGDYLERRRVRVAHFIVQARRH